MCFPSVLQVRAFLVDCLYSRTPQQRAEQDRETSLIVLTRPSEEELFTVPEDRLSQGHFSNVKYNALQLHSPWQFGEGGESLWLFPCADPRQCPPLDKVLTWGLPVTVRSGAFRPFTVKSPAAEDGGGAMLRTATVQLDNPVLSSASSQYCTESQPFFLRGAAKSLAALSERSPYAILEKMSLNANGYVSKVCACVHLANSTSGTRSGVAILCMLQTFELSLCA